MKQYAMNDECHQYPTVFPSVEDRERLRNRYVQEFGIQPPDNTFDDDELYHEMWLALFLYHAPIKVEKARATA